MQAEITYVKTCSCTWCEKEVEGVEVAFESGFLKEAQLCFKCFQQALRVNNKQARSTNQGAKPALKGAS